MSPQPVNSNGRLPFSWKAVTVILSFLGLAFNSGIQWGKVHANEIQLADVKEKQELDHDSVISLGENVSHIKEAVDKQDVKLDLIFQELRRVNGTP